MKDSNKRAAPPRLKASRKKLTDSMDIHAAGGSRVVFAWPFSGYLHHQETAATHLKGGKTYTVERTAVGAWHTDVYLKEVPGVAFNSVHFADAPEAPNEP